MRRIAHLGAVTATALAVLPALPPAHPVSATAATVSTAAPADGDDAEPPPLVISEITPSAVEKDDTVTITGQVTNTTDAPVTDIAVRWHYSPYPLTDRAALERHADGDAPELYASGPSTTIDGELLPGASAPFTLEAEAEELDLHGGFGVYPIAVAATSDDSGDLGELHTFLPYAADDEVEELQVAWVWPLMDRPQRADDDTYLDTELAEEVTEDGRLGRLLGVGAQEGAFDPSYTGPTPEPEESTQSPGTESPDADPSEPLADDADAELVPGPGPEEPPRLTDPVPITWAVDPSLLDDIERLGAGGYWSVSNAADSGAGPALEEHQASTDALVWLAHARLWLADDPLLATPYADPDLSALLEADLTGDAETSVTLGRQTVVELLGREADTELAWPAQGVMDETTRDFLADHGATSFVLDERAMPAQRWLGHTATGVAPLPLGEDEGTALIADSALTGVLGADTHTPGAASLAEQRFVAETAMIAGEAPDLERTLVVAPPRDWDPSAEFASGLLDATDDLPWLDAVSLSDLRPDTDGAEQRTDLTYPEKAAEAELDDEHLGRVKDIRRQVRLFNSVLTEDDDPLRPSVLRLESAWWREDADGAAAALTRTAEAVRESKAKVHVIPGDPITLASSNGTLGVLVANDLDHHSVTVHLSIFSENSERLSVGDYTKSMEIGPGGKTTVYVPLSATVNGRTVLHISLHNADGEPISDEQTMIPVNATGMGSGALVISGVAALVLIIALAPRAVRRWRRERARNAAAAASTAGPDPEAAEAAGGADAEPTPHNGRNSADTGPDGDIEDARP